MNAEQTAELCAIVQELCPRQKMTERTAAVWSVVLRAIPYDQAERAVFAVYAELGDDRQWSRTIEPDMILRECKRRRAAVIADRLAELDPPAHLQSDDPAVVVEYQRWLREAARDLADGRQPAALEAYTPSDRQLAIGAVLSGHNLRENQP